jgi:protein-L-isoaspartate(D-aspartate) O-methyltransferase
MGPAMIDQATARWRMVESQLRPNDVTDRRIVNAMGAVPRERFVDPSRAELAYLDDAAPAPGNTRRLASPTAFARLVQLADIQPADRVLDVGCASGYSTAILARLAGEVVALEEDAGLAAIAGDNLRALGLANVRVIKGGPDAARGQGPFDAIVIEGSVEVVPDGLLQLLAENGRLVAVVRERGQSRANVFVRSGGRVAGRAEFDAVMPPLPGYERPAGFQF